MSEYPNLFAELLARGWAESDLEKVAGLNLLRVLRGTEAVRYLQLLFKISVSKSISTCAIVLVRKVRDQMAVDGVKPFDEWIPQEDLPAEANECNTGEYKYLLSAE